MKRKHSKKRPARHDLYPADYLILRLYLKGSIELKDIRDSISSALTEFLKPLQSAETDLLDQQKPKAATNSTSQAIYPSRKYEHALEKCDPVDLFGEGLMKKSWHKFKSNQMKHLYTILAKFRIIIRLPNMFSSGNVLNLINNVKALTEKDRPGTDALWYLFECAEARKSQDLLQNEMSQQGLSVMGTNPITRMNMSLKK